MQFPANVPNTTREVCVGQTASIQPCWLRCLATGKVGVQDSCLTKPKNELHGQQERVKQESLLKNVKRESRVPRVAGGGSVPAEGA
jgi:hypothetical protein